MQPTEELLLSLKVMRLTRPTLSSPLPITCDSRDLPGNLLNEALQKEANAVQGMETLSTGQFLLLPQSPVNIYLGETFSSLISVYSETQQPVNNVSIKVDLQTSSQRLPLSMNPPKAVLNPDENVNVVIHHEVKEIGTHILVCEVIYNNSMGLQTSFRKFFKIHVLKPLDVKTKFYNAENDDVYLEAQVQNITAGPICLEKIALDASNLFKVTSLNTLEDKSSVFGKTIVLQPNTICQFLYCLTPDSKLATDLKLLSGATNIGKLDIVWRSNLGERGRLQTCQLQRMDAPAKGNDTEFYPSMGPDYGDIRISVLELPNFVVLERPFMIKCKLINNCERTLDLILNLEENDGITWCGISGRKLESIAPHSSQEIELKAIPLIPGLQPVAPIILYDTLQKRTYNYDALGQVFVIINPNEKNEFS